LLSVAYREFRKSAGTDDDLWPAIHISKDPSVFAILFEYAAALLGLFLVFLGLFLGQTLGKPYLDGVASICIGVVLAVAAISFANEPGGLW
jgi:hypothetical protein